MPDSLQPSTSVKERRRAYNRGWYRRNKERAHENTRRWRANNPERSREISRQWRANNPEKVAADIAKRDKAKLHANMKRWRLRNKEKAFAYDRIYGGLRRARGAPSGDFGIFDIEPLLAAQGFECIYCIADLNDGFHLDHMIPLCRGGSNLKENIQALCPSCNSRKRHRTPEEFLVFLGNQNG